MDVCLVIHHTPTVGFYSQKKPLECPDVSYKTLKSMGQINRELSAETPNMTISVDNIGYDFFGNPPVSAKAEIYSHGALVFSGTVDAIQFSPESIQFTLVA